MAFFIGLFFYVCAAMGLAMLLPIALYFAKKAEARERNEVLKRECQGVKTPVFAGPVVWAPVVGKFMDAKRKEELTAYPIKTTSDITHFVSDFFLPALPSHAAYHEAEMKHKWLMTTLAGCKFPYGDLPLESIPVYHAYGKHLAVAGCFDLSTEITLVSAPSVEGQERIFEAANHELSLAA